MIRAEASMCSNLTASLDSFVKAVVRLQEAFPNNTKRQRATQSPLKDLIQFRLISMQLKDKKPGIL